MQREREREREREGEGETVRQTDRIKSAKTLSEILELISLERVGI